MLSYFKGGSVIKIREKKWFFKGYSLYFVQFSVCLICFAILPWTTWIWGETTPPRAGYLMGEVDSLPGTCLSWADWLIKAIPSSTFSSNCHTPSQYFPCAEHSRGRYQTTRDSLCTLEPTELFKLANPKLRTLLCLTFPAETPEKLLASFLFCSCSCLDRMVKNTFPFSPSFPWTLICRCWHSVTSIKMNHLR